MGYSTPPHRNLPTSRTQGTEGYKVTVVDFTGTFKYLKFDAKAKKEKLTLRMTAV